MIPVLTFLMCLGFCALAYVIFKAPRALRMDKNAARIKYMRDYVDIVETHPRFTMTKAERRKRTKHRKNQRKNRTKR